MLVAAMGVAHPPLEIANPAANPAAIDRSVGI